MPSPLLQFLNYLLLGMQMLVLAVIGSAVVYYFRNRIPGDRRERQAGMAGVAVALSGAVSVVLQTLLLEDDVAGVMQFVIGVFVTLCAGALVWIGCQAGILLGDKQGGYWVKQGSRLSSVATACVLGTVLSLAFSMPFFVALEITLPPGYIPSAPAELGAWLTRMIAFSFAEEVAMRGWALAGLLACTGRIRFRPWSANLLVAMIFAVQHTGGVYQMLTAFWAGLILGVIFLRHGLLAAGATHLLLNLATLLFTLLP